MDTHCNCLILKLPLSRGRTRGIIYASDTQGEGEKTASVVPVKRQDGDVSRKNPKMRSKTVIF